MTPEFSRPIRLDTLGAEPRAIRIEADAAERAALAARFDLPAIARLEADATVSREGDSVRAEGRISAAATQSCVATGDPVPATIDEPFVLRFEPETALPADDLELDEGDLDIVPYSGGAIDLGEAVAQGFALALDPFPRSPRAEAELRKAGVLSEEEEAEASRREAGPFAALKRLADGE